LIKITQEKQNEKKKGIESALRTNTMNEVAIFLNVESFDFVNLWKLFQYKQKSLGCTIGIALETLQCKFFNCGACHPEVGHYLGLFGAYGLLVRVFWIRCVNTFFNARLNDKSKIK
jgi:hypothetical protein